MASACAMSHAKVLSTMTDFTDKLVFGKDGASKCKGILAVLRSYQGLLESRKKFHCTGNGGDWHL